MGCDENVNTQIDGFDLISVSYALLSNVLSGNTRQAGFLDVLSSRVNCASCGTSNGVFNL